MRVRVFVCSFLFVNFVGFCCSYYLFLFVCLSFLLFFGFLCAFVQKAMAMSLL